MNPAAEPAGVRKSSVEARQTAAAWEERNIRVVVAAGAGHTTDDSTLFVGAHLTPGGRVGAARYYTAACPAAGEVARKTAGPKSSVSIAGEASQLLATYKPVQGHTAAAAAAGGLDKKDVVDYDCDY